MDLYDQLIATENKLAQLRSVQEQELKRLEKKIELDSSKIRGEELEKQIEHHKLYAENSARGIEEAEKQIASLLEQIGPDNLPIIKQARKDLDALKDKALHAWQINGGTAEEFKQAWEAMKKQHLIRKTFEALGESPLA